MATNLRSVETSMATNLCSVDTSVCRFIGNAILQV